MRGAALTAGLVAWLASSSALAQLPPPDSRGFDAVPQKATPLRDSAITVEGARPGEAGSWRAALLIDWNVQILAYLDGSGKKGNFIPWRVDGHLLGAWTPLSFLEVGADLPVTFAQGDNFQTIARPRRAALLQRRLRRAGRHPHRPPAFRSGELEAAHRDRLHPRDPLPHRRRRQLPRGPERGLRPAGGSRGSRRPGAPAPQRRLPLSPAGGVPEPGGEQRADRRRRRHLGASLGQGVPQARADARDHLLHSAGDALRRQRRGDQRLCHDAVGDADWCPGPLQQAPWCRAGHGTGRGGQRRLRP